ncbi:hypothetical protein HHI36_022196 [Cryptolaemus montrouzieri]|uniref:Uncharacterized protein n=1 Tax=Cryptolaemus montrouzieri TaxID=559131 RepID=A0ABD2MZ30_9CUCU
MYASINMNAVKTLVILVFALTAIYGEELTEDEKKALQIVDDCMKEHDVKKGEFNITDKNPSQKNLCFMMCLVEKDGTLDKDGKVDVESLDSFLDMLKLEQSKKNEIVECFKKVPPIKNVKM